MKSFALPRNRRIKNSREFASIYDRRIRAADDFLLIWAAPNSVGRPRFGVSVSRKLGNAVRRASLKRLLREAFRLSQHELPNDLDLILIPQRSTVGTAELADYQESLVKLATRLARQVGARQKGPAS